MCYFGEIHASLSKELNQHPTKWLCNQQELRPVLRDGFVLVPLGQRASLGVDRRRVGQSAGVSEGVDGERRDPGQGLGRVGGQKGRRLPRSALRQASHRGSEVDGSICNRTIRNRRPMKMFADSGHLKTCSIGGVAMTRATPPSPPRAASRGGTTSSRTLPAPPLTPPGTMRCRGADLKT